LSHGTSLTRTGRKYPAGLIVGAINDTSPARGRGTCRRACEPVLIGGKKCSSGFFFNFTNGVIGIHTIERV
jgi:hypothetical protein